LEDRNEESKYEKTSWNTKGKGKFALKMAKTMRKEEEFKK